MRIWVEKTTTHKARDFDSSLAFQKKFIFDRETKNDVLKSAGM
jgi:hypothetical protein